MYCWPEATNARAEVLKGSPLLPLMRYQPYSQTVGAGDRTRTGTGLLPTDFKSVAATITPRPHNQCGTLIGEGTRALQALPHDLTYA